MPKKAQANDGKPASVSPDVEPLVKIQQDIDEGVDIWEEAVTYGIQLTKQLDDNRWKLAELVSKIVIKYGESDLKKFANAINDSAKRLIELRQVFNFWQHKPEFEGFRESPVLMYTHFRLGMRIANSLQDDREAVWFVEDCLANEWYVSKAEIEADKRMGKETTPEKLAEGDVTVMRADGKFVTLQVEDVSLLNAFKTIITAELPISLKVYQAVEETVITETYDDETPEPDVQTDPLAAFEGVPDQALSA